MQELLFLNEIETTIENGKQHPEGDYEDVNASIVEWITNWDFKKVNTDLYTHKIHKYPAMFIPQLTRKLIQKFSSESDTILDIFSGSGTLMVEATLLNRNSIGIEINPLAILISKVKTSVFDFNLFVGYYKELINKYFEDDFLFETLQFENVGFWFHDITIKNLSKIIYIIKRINHTEISNFLQICISEIIREVSLCRHSGFKMHRDPAKLDKPWDSEKLFEYFHKTVVKNLAGVVEYSKATEGISAKPEIIIGDSKTLQSIPKESVDLIITSPPYGDSHTTVAYGQFSRLSAQCLGLETEADVRVEKIDNVLLGGLTRGISTQEEVLNKSLTLNNAHELFLHKLKLLEEDKKTYKTFFERYKDVISFYKDLDLTISNASYYLKPGKYFILITGSRIVKEIKLHTDIIIAELAESYGFELKNIAFRNIINKRMPSKVSATNIVGEKSATMTRESIIILYKLPPK